MSQLRAKVPIGTATTSDFTQPRCAQCKTAIPDGNGWACDDEPHQFCTTCVTALFQHMDAQDPSQQQHAPALSELVLCASCHQNFGPLQPLQHGNSFRRSTSNSNLRAIGAQASSIALERDPTDEQPQHLSASSVSSHWSAALERKRSRREFLQRILVFVISPALLGLAIPVGILGGSVLAFQKLYQRRGSRDSSLSRDDAVAAAAAAAPPPPPACVAPTTAV